MNYRLVFIPLFIFTFFSLEKIYAQEGKIIELVNADSLVGKVLGNENVRILIGNVRLIQGDVSISCDRGIQFYETNKAELEGNVKVVQKNVTIIVPQGMYYGDTKFAYGNKGVKLNDGKINLVADSGGYYFNEKKAVFRGNVKLYDDTTTLTSDFLIYYPEVEKSIAVGNVVIQQKESTIKSDSLVHLRKEEITFADGNVQLENTKDNIKIFSGHLENYQKKKYSLITVSPLLMQLDTTENQKIDTLLLSAKKIETFRDTIEMYIASDSVKIWRNGFASINKITKYYKSSETFVTYKLKPNDEQPVFWYENNQSFGDSIIVFIKDRKIEQATIFNDAFIISQDSLNPIRFNQLNGNFMRLTFENNQLKSVLVQGNALSIYYLYEENEPNGLNKSSGDSLLIEVVNNQVDRITLFGNPEGEYHPEELITGKEKDFQLAGFKWIENKPKKEEMLSNSRIKTDIKNKRQ
ncbi:MAG: hypothetical protein N3A61_06295 [Ignavibacteria bacterium]|nr:hypothetical protein [Ignavibacteria bacterium]